jgi:catechol 2,3-dioxygenase-like lactoylglutathione lyase family enzyme
VFVLAVEEVSMGIEVEGLDHVALAVSEHALSVRWYRELLGLERSHPEWGDAPAMVMAGNGSGLALFPAGDRPLGFLHLAFRADRARYEAAKETLTREGVAFEEQDHGTSHSIYFADPDGVRLEITTYEM